MAVAAPLPQVSLARRHCTMYQSWPVTASTSKSSAHCRARAWRAWRPGGRCLTGNLNLPILEATLRGRRRRCSGAGRRDCKVGRAWRRLIILLIFYIFVGRLEEAASAMTLRISIVSAATSEKFIPSFFWSRFDCSQILSLDKFCVRNFIVPIDFIGLHWCSTVDPTSLSPCWIFL